MGPDGERMPGRQDRNLALGAEHLGVETGSRVERPVQQRNAGCPGYVATDLNGFRGVRTPEQGAVIAIGLATLPDDGPTGKFFEDAGVVPW